MSMQVYESLLIRIIFNFILFQYKGDSIVVKKNSYLMLIMITIIIHLFLGGLGLVLYYSLDQNNELGCWIFVVIFILLKLFWFYYYSSGKKIVELVANFIMMIALSCVDFLMLFSIILTTVKLLNSGRLLFSNGSELFIFILCIIMLIIVMPIIERNVMKKTTTEKILPAIIVIFFEIIISVILYFIDTTESAIVSAFTALLILLLTTENIEVLFNVKLCEYRKQQISLIRFYIIFLVPFIYLVSKYVPNPKEKRINVTKILDVGLKRFVCLLIIFGIMLGLIYWNKIRKRVQKFFGLSSNQVKLNGNWVMIDTNPYTKNDLIIRSFILTIDGRRIKYNNKIFYFNENLKVLNDEEKEIGLIQVNNSNNIVIKIDELPSGDSKLIKLIKVGSDEYKKFNQNSKKKNVVFKNINIPDPITENELEVTIFFVNNNDKKCHYETNCKTNDRYEFKNGVYVKLESNEECSEDNGESLLDPRVYNANIFK